LMK
jgi:hypothetical protein